MNINKPDFSKLKAVFVSTRDAKAQVGAICQIQKILSDFGLKMLVQEHCAKALKMSEFYSLDEIFEKTNLILSLGGDGNYIGTCRRFAQKDAYIIGIHTGNLGFLTDVLLSGSREFLSEVLAGDFITQKVRFLSADFKGEQSRQKLAFNDIVLCRKHESSSAHIEAFLGGESFNSYYGDGVIIASPMGSTAYNMSAGGAIIHPDTRAFCLTPICPHSLTQRPLILPDDFVVEFTSKDDISVIIDGQKHIDLKDFKSVKISLSEQKISLIRRKNRNYFSVLKEKLSWGS